jgi:hypothetical protein
MNADMLVREQPAPAAAEDGPGTWDHVIADAIAERDRHEPGDLSWTAWDRVAALGLARDAEGRRRYGTPLAPHNGRDSLVDCVQELLDATVYIKNHMIESGESVLYITYRSILCDLMAVLRELDRRAS